MLVQPTGEGNDEKRERIQSSAHGAEIIAQSAASHSNHFNQIEFLHSTRFTRLHNFKSLFKIYI